MMNAPAVAPCPAELRGDLSYREAWRLPSWLGPCGPARLVATDACLELHASRVPWPLATGVVLAAVCCVELAFRLLGLGGMVFDLLKYGLTLLAMAGGAAFALRALPKRPFSYQVPWTDVRGVAVSSTPAGAPAVELSLAALPMLAAPTLWLTVGAGQDGAAWVRTVTPRVAR